MPTQFVNIPTDSSNKIRINPYEWYSHFDSRAKATIYLSKDKPITYQFVECNLMRVEIRDDMIIVSRRVSEARSGLSVVVTYQRFSSANIPIDSFATKSLKFEIRKENDRHRFLNEFQLKAFYIPLVPDYSYAKISLSVGRNNRNEYYDEKELKKLSRKKRGFVYCKCNNGGIRLHKKILSDASPFFKKLFFEMEKKEYQLDVDLMDMMQFVFCLPPFNRCVNNGVVYGALYRLSEKFKCWCIADMCDEFIEKIKIRMPMSASLIAREGNVEHEAKLYVTKRRTYKFSLLPTFLKEYAEERQFREQLVGPATNIFEL